MGYYDIGVKYTVGKPLTYTSLCKEIMDEYENATGCTPPGEETIRDKFKNAQESGLINKLNKLFGYNIEENISDNEKHKLFKLLKLLYYIEKSGEPKYKAAYEEDLRIQITDILEKPRLENIQTELSEKSVYGKYFESLYDNVKSEVEDADIRFQKLESINIYWEYLTEKVFDYVITDRALDEPENALFELERIRRFLQERVLDRLSYDKIPKSSDGGVVNTFYNKLVCHRLMCRDIDRININYQICLSPEPSAEYIAEFKKWEGYGVPKKLQADIKDYICSSTENEDVKGIIDFVLRGIEKEHWKEKAFKFAIKNFDTVLNWWTEGKDIDVKESVPIDIFTVIMQEMVVVNNSKEGFRNDYLGYNNPNRSLSVAVKKPNEADAVAVEAWKKKLENRTVVNFGASELIKKKREIENCIYQIKQYIYSFNTISEIEFVNEMLCRFVARSIISRDLAMHIGNEFAQLVCKYLTIESKDITFILDDGGINVLNMFRDFTIDQFNIKELVAKDFARQINEFYKEKSTCFAKGMRCDFEIALSQEKYWDNVVTFIVNKKSNQIIYKQYVGVRPDAECDEMRRLGLEEFIGDDKKELKFF